MFKLTPNENIYTLACLAGDIDTFVGVFKKENKKFKSFKFLQICMINACERGHINIVKTILDYIDNTSNIIVDVIAHNYTTGTFLTEQQIELYHSFRGGNLDIINIVIERTAIITKYDWYLALYGACETNKIDVFDRYLHNVITNKTNNIADNNFLNICLEKAGLSNSMEIINYLSAKGATNWHECLLSVCQSGCVETFRYICDHKINVSDINLEQKMYLVNACEGGSLEIINFIFALYEKRKLSYSIQTGGSCMNYACMGGHIEVINLLINKKFDYWNEGLTGACSNGNVEIAKMMIRKGAFNFNWCLYVACVAGHKDVAKLMITSGASFDNRFSFNDCLYRACYCNDLELIIMLTSSDESIGKVVNWNEGLNGACGSNNSDILEFILDHGTFTTKQLNHVLLKSAQTNYIDVCILLIRKGADISCLKNIRDFKLYTMYLQSLNIYTCLTDCTDADICAKYLKCLVEYPPCILFVGCRLTKTCSVKRLPVELFRLLSQYV